MTTVKIVSPDGLMTTDVQCCADCPMNRAFDNPLWKRLAPVHYCIAQYVPNQPGRVLYFPHGIPEWCPARDTD